MILDQPKADMSNPPHNFSETTLQEHSTEGNSYFPPDSIIRRIDREGVVLLGGGRSILLQLAHPFVAAGVDQHSNFQDEITDRLYRTLLFMHNLVVKDRRYVSKSLRRFHAMHQRIRGHLPQAAGCFSAGTPYSGTDPRAKLWVHATFVDTALKVYEQFVKRLTPDERRKYYADTLVVGQLLEIPQEIMPPTLEDFRGYMAGMLSSDTLEVTATARRLAHAVLYPRVGFFPTVSAGLLRFVTAGILPERFRREYGLKWSRKQQFKLNCFSRSIRTLRPFTPAWIWQNPLLGGRMTRFLLWG
jgi:uncharacterized protein (DUF2236 family)